MPTITPTTVEELLDYWPGNIPFKGSLVSDDGSCMCAQGQALHFLDKYSSSDLRNIKQETADKRVAELFGISRAHSVLLRIVNDRQDGAPACVIRNPEQVLGNQAHVVLAFWRHLDRMTAADWVAAWAAARDAAWAAARGFRSGRRSTFPMLDANTPTYQRDEHMSSEAKQANLPTGSVVIGEAQNTGKDEAWCDWYRCPKCNESNIIRAFSFCPDCGVELQWEGGVTDA